MTASSNLYRAAQAIFGSSDCRMCMVGDSLSVDASAQTGTTILGIVRALAGLGVSLTGWAGQAAVDGPPHAHLATFYTPTNCTVVKQRDPGKAASNTESKFSPNQYSDFHFTGAGVAAENTLLFDFNDSPSLQNSDQDGYGTFGAGNPARSVHWRSRLVVYQPATAGQRIASLRCRALRGDGSNGVTEAVTVVDDPVNDLDPNDDVAVGGTGRLFTTGSGIKYIEVDHGTGTGRPRHQVLLPESAKITNGKYLLPLALRWYRSDNSNNPVPGFSICDLGRPTYSLIDSLAQLGYAGNPGGLFNASITPSCTADAAAEYLRVVSHSATTTTGPNFYAVFVTNLIALQTGTEGQDGPNKTVHPTGYADEAAALTAGNSDPTYELCKALVDTLDTISLAQNGVKATVMFINDAQTVVGGAITASGIYTTRWTAMQKLSAERQNVCALDLYQLLSRPYTKVDGTVVYSWFRKVDGDHWKQNDVGYVGAAIVGPIRYAYDAPPIQRSITPLSFPVSTAVYAA